MWWLIPVGIGLKIIYDMVSDDEKEARRRWEEKYEEAEEAIEYHQKNIEQHIRDANSCYEFHKLVDMHYSSVKVADNAYRLLKDSRQSLNGINKMLKKAKEERQVLQNRLRQAKIANDLEIIDDTIKQLKMIQDMEKNLFEEKKKIYEQTSSFLQEVRRLNHQTHELKELIKSRCGQKGEKWYSKLEQRKKLRQSGQNRQKQIKAA